MWRQPANPIIYQEKFEVTTGIIRGRKQGTENTMVNRKGAKRQTMINKTLHRKRRIDQHEPTKNRG